METIIIIWAAFGLMNLGGYASTRDATWQEAAIFFMLGPIVSFVWIGSVVFKQFGK